MGSCIISSPLPPCTCSSNVLYTRRQQISYCKLWILWDFVRFSSNVFRCFFPLRLVYSRCTSVSGEYIHWLLVHIHFFPCWTSYIIEVNTQIFRPMHIPPPESISSGLCVCVWRSSYFIYAQRRHRSRMYFRFPPCPCATLIIYLCFCARPELYE